MKERPILFSGDMVRAIRDGRKTETRRPVKPQPWAAKWDGIEDRYNTLRWRPGHGNDWPTPELSPHGRPSNLLWVRETWGMFNHSDPEGDVFYLADEDKGNHVLRWRPSIHMPRWACRLVLEVLAVRVERLQDITEEGAKAEGVLLTNKLPDGMEGLFRPRFAGLWNSIYGKRPGLAWEDNPWVWVTGFKPMEQPASLLLAAGESS